MKKVKKQVVKRAKETKHTWICQSGFSIEVSKHVIFTQRKVKNQEKGGEGKLKLVFPALPLCSRCSGETIVLFSLKNSSPFAFCMFCSFPDGRISSTIVKVQWNEYWF